MGTIEEEMHYISKRRNLPNSGSLENQHIVFAQMCNKDKTQVKQAYEVSSYIQ